jgi:hypothetical protein
MTLTEARELAAQAWCQPATSGKQMDVELALAFAEILMFKVHRAEVRGDLIRSTNKPNYNRPENIC